LLVVTGSDGYKSSLKIITNKDQTHSNFSIDDGKFTQVSFIKTNKSKISGFVTGSDKGNLNIFS